MSVVKQLIVFGFCLSFWGLAQAQPTPAPLAEIENLDAKNRDSRFVESAEISDKSVDAVRTRAQRDTAYALAFQAGTKWRYEQINRLLESLSPQLDMIYDFAGLMLDEIVEPPLVDFTDGSFAVKSDRLAQENLRAFRIRKPARIVSAPPHWRGYLIRHFKVEKRVHPAVLPRTAAARKVWREAARRGWRDGVRHAEKLFDAQLYKLRRDFLGMMQYHVLASQNIILPVFLAKSHLGNVHDDRLLEIDQRIYRITRQARFNDDKVWRIILASPTNR